MCPPPSVFKTRFGFKQALLHHLCCAANRNDGNVTSRRCHFCADIVGEAREKSSRTGTRTKGGRGGTVAQGARVTPNTFSAAVSLTSGCIANRLLVAKVLNSKFLAAAFLEH